MGLMDRDKTRHPHIKVITETKQGLTFARIKGYNESAAEFLIFVDDDNVLDPKSICHESYFV